MKENRELYKEFCIQEMSIPLFSKDWWLDAVCGKDGWDVLLYYKDEELLASMPYYLKKKLLFKINKMPILTQSLGIFIKYPEGLIERERLNLEKKVYNFFIKNLPKADAHFINFHYSVTNWLPFFWKGFSQTTRYTYVIKDISDPAKVFENFSRAKKKNIRKAAEILDVKYDMSAQDFYKHHKRTLNQIGSKIVYPYSVFESLYLSAYKNGTGRTIYAEDKVGNIHSAIFCVWDNNSAYDLISTIDQEFKVSGSASLLVYELIKYLSDKVQCFDFEGSMIENVENSFKQFGASQTPYFRIFKVNNPILNHAYHYFGK